eukprot:2267010-Pleurochrysis_carterae.AAC.1
MLSVASAKARARCSMWRSLCSARPASSLLLSSLFATCWVNSKRARYIARTMPTPDAPCSHSAPAAGKLNEPAKKRDPKRTEKPNTFASQWNAKYGACLHCGGKHWHGDCPRRPKPDAVAKKDGSANRALTTAVPESELFVKDGGATVSFSVPSDARALCAHDSIDS